MITKGQLLEFAQVQPAFQPVALHNGSATGDWVSMKNFDRILVKVVASEPSTTADTIAITIQQAVNASGGSAKGLSPKRVQEKESTDTVFGDVGVWTDSTGTLGGGTTGSTYAGSGNKKAGVWAFDISSAELDVDNSFDFVRVQVAQTDETSSPVYAYGEYILYNAKYPNKPANMVSVIA